MPPKRGTRATRAFTATEPMPTRSTRSQSRQAGPVKDRSSLVADPIARKGAPRGVSASEAEIPTSPRRNEDSDDDVEVGAENGRLHVVAQVSEEDLEFMCQCVYKLGSTAENILSHYRVFGDKDKLARRAFIMDMDNFASVRKQFLVDEGYAPYLHWAWATTPLTNDELDALKVAVILANLATLLETIWEGAWKNLDEAGSPNVEKLRIIDEEFQDLLTGGFGFLINVTEAVLKLALEVRVAHVLAALTKADKNSDARKIMYDIFCDHRKDPTSAQINATLENGPYKRFASIDTQELDSLCREHIAVFSKHIGKNNVTFSNLPTIRKQYPAKSLLATIQTVFRDFGEPIDASRGIWKQLEHRDQSPNEFFDAASGGEDDISSDEDESQPIVRASNTDVGHSLFRDQADAEALERVQVTASGGIFAVDHGAAPFPSALSHRPADRVSSTPANHHQRSKRTHDQATTSDDGGDDDVFETDTRTISEAVHLKRRLTTKADATRVDREIRRRQQQQQQQEHSPFFPSSSLSTSTTAVGGSTQVDKHARQANSVVRRNDPRGTTTTTNTVALADGDASSVPRPRPSMHNGRVRWSQHDDEALLASIAKHYAKWADIERQAKHLFEHPRDQQAYRDRARNLKVKYILNDEPLPYGFDWVTLGPKEKERLLKHGKNYERMEADIDKNTGRPTNTEYIPAQVRDTPGSE
ncbi:hypothetical protein BM221_010274 [Beauveria bassiana]|uniref:Myb-like domain-containing protein n=1 Tax=Beauveria bassiana TaxID=176275 RepID=A0A2N6N940_BEABA|nr:hypothetical protein BM221_010274 [Beauveria bassiana]